MSKQTLRTVIASLRARECIHGVHLDDLCGICAVNTTMADRSLRLTALPNGWSYGETGVVSPAPQPQEEPKP